jgi:hypothetical protein
MAHYDMSYIRQSAPGHQLAAVRYWHHFFHALRRPR